VLVLVAVMTALAIDAVGAPSATAQTAQTAQNDKNIPVLAYYYQWFDASSWNRAKRDYPLSGRYSSDDPTVMTRHITQAKAAGIDGFIVSWKDTPVNDRRLSALMDVARQEHFKLAVIYQGLDFSRRPLPIERVARDMAVFRDEYATDPVFDIFGKPMLIWSGTWAFDAADIASVTARLRQRLLVLATEKSVEGYARVASSFDGDAYYWSSVDPLTNPGYARKLRDMSSAVHGHGGLWLAPFAPGFDARDVGGTSTVPRRDGQTLRAEYGAAVGSSPDALALISWNEFSENTHVEPSEANGATYLTVLRSLIGTTSVTISPLAQDSSDSPSGKGRSMTGLFAILVISLLMLVPLAWRLLARDPQPARSAGPTAQPFRARWRHNVARHRLLVMALMAAALVLLLVAGSNVFGASLWTGAGTASPLYIGAQPVRSSAQAVVVAAGDIACPADKSLLTEEKSSPGSCRMQDTAGLIGQVGPDAVLALGDNQYPSGSLKEYVASYEASWGKFKGMTFPVPGNHEYGSPEARGYFAYFGPRAGDADKGYYSYDLGAWHVIALNSECAHVGGCQQGSPQEEWLRADLAAHPTRCTLAYWHKPRYSSGNHGADVEMGDFWRDLMAAKAELVLSGHDHDYERLAPLDNDGQPSPQGVRAFVVGTGGDTHYKFQRPVAGSQFRLAGTFGLLKLTLHATSYDWSFLASPGGAVMDSGSAPCA